MVETKMAETKTAETLLEIDGIETCYGLSQVLFGLSLKVRSGEMVALMGRNGMGKTTTIRSIMGMTPARSGKVRFAGEEVRSLPSYKIAKLGIGLVPEGRQIFPNLTVYENLVAASGNRMGNRDPWTIEKIHALFPRLAERSSNMGVTLSGGEQQMLALARAMMARPKLLMMDEPSLGIAPIVVQSIFRTLQELKGTGVAMLLVEQNISLALDLADRAYVLRTGAVSLSGPARRLKADYDKVAAAYLGARP
jgi:branched-chain amino acid transport system ATP-binding protein